MADDDPSLTPLQRVHGTVKAMKALGPWRLDTNDLDRVATRIRNDLLVKAYEQEHPGDVAAMHDLFEGVAFNLRVKLVGETATSAALALMFGGIAVASGRLTTRWWGFLAAVPFILLAFGAATRGAQITKAMESVARAKEVQGELRAYVAARPVPHPTMTRVLADEEGDLSGVAGRDRATSPGKKAQG